MREEQQIAALMVAVFIIGLGGLFLMGGIPGFASESISLGSSYVDDYRADLYLNGTLDEHFKYRIEDPSLNIISRSWPYQLSFSDQDIPYVEITGFAPIPGAVPYAKSWRGDMRILSGEQEMDIPQNLKYAGIVASLANPSEAGCYKPDYFSSGSYEIGYILKDHPPIERDEKYCHWNLKLADDHMAYNAVTIKVHDPRGDIVQLFPHPNMASQKVGDAWVITGRSPENGLLKVEMLLKPDTYKLLDGFPRNVSDVEGKTLLANKDASQMKTSMEPSTKGSISSDTENIRIERYNADIYLNGTIVEKFLYRINQPYRYRMLYRYLKTPMSIDRLDRNYFEPIKVTAPIGTIAYVKDYRGKAWILTPNGTLYSKQIYDLAAFADELSAIARNNEVGYYSEDGAFKNSTEAIFHFKIHPAVQCDDKHCLLSLTLGERHLPYKHLTVAIHDPDGYIDKIFTYQKLNITREESDWIIAGESPQDQILKVDILMSSDAARLLNGSVQPAQDLDGQVVSAESEYPRNAVMATAFSVGMRMLVLLAPLMILGIYRRYGKERTFTVPNVLSFVPGNRKPWQVNLVFKEDPFDFDKDGFYATILNLQRLGIIDIESDIKGGLRIKLLKGHDAVEDEYERRVLDFLNKNAENGILDIEAFDEKAKKLRDRAEDDSVSALDALRRIRNDMSELLAGPDDATSHDFFASYTRPSTVLVAIPIGLIAGTGILFTTFGDLYPQIALGFYSSIILLVQLSIPAFAAPKILFGRWKADYYKEKLEWDAFRNFLSDFAMIQKYAPEDMSIWKDWLVYGTALGVGNKVVKAMEQLEIPALPEARAVIHAPEHFEHAYSISSEHIITRSEREVMSRSSGGGGGGGGFGGGGGDGGGGGGAR